MRAANDNLRGRPWTARELLTREALHKLAVAHTLFISIDEPDAANEVAGVLARILSRPLGGLPVKGDRLA